MYRIEVIFLPTFRGKRQDDCEELEKVYSRRTNRLVRLSQMDFSIVDRRWYEHSG